MKDKTIDKINKTIKNIQDEELDDDEKVENDYFKDTLKTDDLSTITSDQKEDTTESNQKAEKKEVEEDSIVNPSKDENNNLMNKKKSKKKKIIISIIVIIALLITAFLVWFFLLKKESTPPKKEKTTVALSKKEQKNIIKTYGSNVEAAIAIEYMKSQTILEYDKVIELVHNDDKVVCNIHEIYTDGKVYLDECSIKGKKTTYSYGTKQEKDEEPAVNANTITVYVNKTTFQKTLTKPTDTTNYDIYTVDAKTPYNEVSIFEYADYIVYFDEEYNGYLKNYKTNKVVLPGLNYTSVIPLKYNDTYVTTHACFMVNGKWGVYNLDTGLATIPCTYDYIVNSLTMGVSGPPIYIDTLGDSSIVLRVGDKVGLVNYTNNREVIPVIYSGILKVGNYLTLSENYQDKIKVFDYYGNEYLQDMPNKYGMTTNGYVFVIEDNHSKLYTIDKKLIYDFGEFTGETKVNFYYKNMIQYIKESPDKCIEYSYEIETKKGKTIETQCGGIAKPILYLYPKKKTKVTVKFEHPELLETTYPKYKNKWTVTAHKNGDLYDEDGKYYYGLYWDEKKVHTVDFSTGFYVEKDNAISFLEEKLNSVGLNKKERNEFIMYWLPYLERNEKSLVYFELTDERESYDKINISPKPDSLLRLVIHIKKVDKKVSIKEQIIPKFKRKGFVAVEWGGTAY